MKMKRIVSVFMLVLLVCSLTMPAFATSDTTTTSKVYTEQYTLFPNGVEFVGGGVVTGVVTSDLLSCSTVAGGTKSNSICYSAATIDLTEWETITFWVDSYKRSGNVQLNAGVNDDISVDTNSTYVSAIAVRSTGIQSLDISSITGEHYILVNSWGVTADGALTISKIVLSKTVEISDSSGSDGGDATGGDATGGDTTPVVSGNLFLDASLEELTVTEGLLSVIVVILLLGLIIKAFNR